jgi:hypothetical protein
MQQKSFIWKSNSRRIFVFLHTKWRSAAHARTSERFQTLTTHFKDEAGQVAVTSGSPLDATGSYAGCHSGADLQAILVEPMPCLVGLVARCQNYRLHW